MAVTNYPTGIQGINHAADPSAAWAPGIHIGYSGTVGDPASANYGVLSIGGAQTLWDGSTSGFFVGSSSGTKLAINAESAYAGSLADWQVAGVRQFRVAVAVASLPAVSIPGTWFTTGDATTTKPQLLVEPTGTTSTGWSTSGTGIGVNAASGFGGNLLDLQVAASRKFAVSSTGSAMFADGANLVFGTVTGTKIADGTTQKLGFHNATPTAQRAGAAQAAVDTTGATSSTPFGYSEAQANGIVTLLNELRAALVQKGVIKGAA